MDTLLQQLETDPWGRLVLQYLVTGGLQANFLFLLVSARLAGVLLVAPYFLKTMIPVSVRCGLTLMLAMIITPVLSGRLLQESRISLVTHQSGSGHELPVSDLGCLVLNELGLGTLLGVGIIIVLSGLRMGGDWLDRQTGLSIGSMMNPDYLQSESGSSSLVQMLGVVIFLLLKPVGGLILCLRSLMQSFQIAPVGLAGWTVTLDQVMSGLVQQSFELGLRLAIPLIAAMTLIDLTLAFIGRDTALPFGSFNMIVRTALSMVVLALTMTMLPEVISTAALSMLETLQGVR